VDYPSCFEDRETYRVYRRSLLESGDRPSKACAWCWDCRPEYKAAMLQRGECIRTNTTFVKVVPIEGFDEFEPEPGVHGVSPQFKRELTQRGRLVND